MKTIHRKNLPREKVAEKHLVDHPVASVFFSSGTKKPDKNLLNDFILLKEEKAIREKASGGMFFCFSLCLSLLLVIYAFEWRSTEDSQTLEISQTSGIFDDLIDVPQTKQIAKPPAVNIAPAIIEVSDERVIENIEINLDIEMSEDTRIEEVVYQAPTISVIPEEKVDEVFTIVEEQPKPNGGMPEFYKYVAENLKYPIRASRMGIEGRVFVEFIVEKDGSLTDIKVARGIGGGCDEEAMRVIAEAPKWSPGKQRGRPVRVRMIMPIVFKIIG